MVDEQILIDKYISGDNEALTQCYNNWKAELFLVAYHYLRTKQDSEDVVSHCFSRLLEMTTQQRFLKFHQEQFPLKAYLLVMIKNRCLDEIKIKNNRRRLDIDFSNLNSGTIQNEGFEVMNMQNLRNLSARLPSMERDIISLHLDGYSAQEIAAKFCISEKTVRNRISLAKGKLREIWSKFMEQ